jgi:hypothetical protein
LIRAHPVSSAQQHSPTQEAFWPRRPSRPSPSSGQAGLSRHPDRAPTHTAIPTSPPPSFLLHGRHVDHPASPTESSPIPTALFLLMPKRPALMPPLPAAARCLRSLPGPINGADTAVGAHRHRLHSPFLPSSLGALSMLSHFGRHHLPPSPGQLTAFRSRVRSQAGSSPPPPPFRMPPASIGEPEHRPGDSLMSPVPPSMSSPSWTEAECGPRPVD